MEQLLWKTFEKSGCIASYMFYKAYQNEAAMDSKPKKDQVATNNLNLLEANCKTASNMVIS